MLASTNALDNLAQWFFVGGFLILGAFSVVAAYSYGKKNKW